MCLHFHDTYEDINPRFLDNSLKEQHFALNDMDNFLYETDVYSPEEFYMVVREMEGSLGLM